VPAIGHFFTNLPLVDTFLELHHSAISPPSLSHDIPTKSRRRPSVRRWRLTMTMAARRFVPPSFNDVRRLLNAAQIRAIAPNLRLITFDGDVTMQVYGMFSNNDL
jgi:hypothetical protein